MAARKTHGGKRKGAGRPSSRLASRVMVQLTQEERAMIDATREPGESLSSAVRWLVLRGLGL